MKITSPPPPDREQKEEGGGGGAILEVSPPLLLSPSPFPILILLCFLISALLCFGFTGIKGKWLAVSSVAFPALQPLWLSQLDHTELVKYFIISLLCTFCSR